DTTPLSFSFNTDGSSMYVLGGDNDTIFQYTLATPWDVSTAEYDTLSFSVTREDTTPLSFSFNTDGSSMYVLGGDNDTIFQYTLATPWDVSTAEFGRLSVSALSETSAVASFKFDAEGTKIFLLGGNIVYQYNLTTPWDISSATFSDLSFDASGVRNLVVSSIVLKNDDTKIYLVDDTTDTLLRYTIDLSDPLPTITSVSSSVENGQYTTGDVVDIVVSFSEAVTSEEVTITLETGITDRRCVLSVQNTNRGVCEYRVQESDVSSDLDVKEISGVISGRSGRMANFVPSVNLAENKDIVILPVIADVSVLSSNESATFTWETSDNRSSLVEYGLTNAYGLTTEEINTAPRVRQHSVEIDRLLSCSSYYYRVVSSDENANNVKSEGGVFTTTGCTGSATVKDQTITSVNKDTGGTPSLLSESRGISLIVPARATQENPVYQIKSLEQEEVFQFSSTPDDVVKVGNYAFDLKSLLDIDVSVTEFSEPIEVTIDYTNEDVVGIDESTLVIYRWNGTVWNRLNGCVVDTEVNSVTCTTTRFSVFSLFGEPVAQQNSGNTNTSTQGSVPLWALGEDVNKTKNVQALSSDVSLCKKEGTCSVVTTSSVDKSTDSNVSKIGSYDSKYLGFGLVDDTVKKLQRYLNSKGYLLNNKGPGSPGLETNFFGPLTRSAVIKFQKANNLKVDGIVGPETNSLIQ
ncbi:peptidoglycan-binding protein, partial [Candidatus Nomurabacteria bacterium]|nr:peptidoglycan-binding protein [Candidatus Nomurabacteria bacterium]